MKKLLLLALVFCLIAQPAFSAEPVSFPAIVIKNATTNEILRRSGSGFEIPFAYELVLEAGELAWAQEETNLEDLGEHAGGAATAAITYERLKGIEAANNAFLKNNYSTALGALVKQHNNRANALVKYKVADLFTDSGAKAYTRAELAAASNRTGLVNKLRTIASSADDVVVRTEADRLLSALNVVPNTGDDFLRVLQTAGYKATPANLTSLSPLQYLKNQHTLFTGGMKPWANQLTSAGYTITTDAVHGLEVTAPTGEVFQISKIKGVSSLDDLASNPLSKGFMMSRAATTNAAAAATAMDAVRAARITNLKDAFVKYDGASGMTKWYYKRGLEKAVTEAQNVGLGVKFESGVLKAVKGTQETMLTTADDFSRALGRSTTAVNRAGVMARIGQRIGQSKIAQTRVGQAVGKYGGKTLRAGGKVLKAGATFAGLPAGLIKGLAWGYCGFISSDFVDPAGQIILPGENKLETFPNLAGENEVAESVFYKDTDFEYEIYQNAEYNIDRVKSCLREAYETEGDNVLVRFIIGVSEFFNPVALVEDVAYWIYSPSQPLDQCVWRIYSDSETISATHTIDPFFSCKPDEATTVKSSSFPEGRYAILLYGKYSEDMMGLLEDPDNQHLTKMNTNITHLRYGLNCRDYIDCVEKYGDYYGMAPIVIEVSSTGLAGGWIGLKVANLPANTHIGKTLETMGLFSNETMAEKVNFESRISTDGKVIYIKPEGLRSGMTVTYYMKIQPKDPAGKELDLGGKLVLRITNLDPSTDLEEPK
ncbi:MAG: hypothetical protein JW744_04040 [Candidatus Diapherotrites archaeon]|uniref:Uncharacterized protein n=1 Tax=Candidatus Iainarchaeum sp. TaxID=3101447 RepID=A0A938YU74_9ARCH|nr:hypothetical protein [Candidatus Diapherotrites archaeon]